MYFVRLEKGGGGGCGSVFTLSQEEFVGWPEVWLLCFGANKTWVKCDWGFSSKKYSVIAALIFL